MCTLSAVLNVLGETVPEVGESSVAPGLVLGPKWHQREKKCGDGAGWCERNGFMEGFITEKNKFEMNPVWDRKPIKLLEHRSGVIKGGRSE